VAACWKNSVQSQFGVSQVPLNGTLAGLPGFLGEGDGQIFSGCHQPGSTHSKEAISLQTIESQDLSPNAAGNVVLNPSDE